VRGSILPNQASVHVYSGARDNKRDAESMEVRLDAKVDSVEATRQLGGEGGDFVSFDARVEVNDGFVRSRHLDDKAAVAVLVAVVQALHTTGLKPTKDTIFLVSNYEEVGFGGASDFPATLEELVAVDMAAGPQSAPFLVRPPALRQGKPPRDTNASHPLVQGFRHAATPWRQGAGDVGQSHLRGGTGAPPGVEKAGLAHS